MSPTYSVCKTHGYLVGEQFTCPHCGEKAEVYSRITGYYRPVQNWNEGKSQEYKNRKIYRPDNFREMPLEIEKSECACAEDSTSMEDGLYLFTTKTCPNCRLAKEFLKGMAYAVVDAEENQDLANEYSIMQAPTLIAIKEGNIEKYVNASNIKRFVDEQVVFI